MQLMNKNERRAGDGQAHGDSHDDDDHFGAFVELAPVDCQHVNDGDQEANRERRRENHLEQAQVHFCIQRVPQSIKQGLLLSLNLDFLQL